MDDVRWVNVTVVGSAYEEQLDVYSGKHRRRPLKLGSVSPFEDKGIGAWEYIGTTSTSNAATTHDPNT